MTTMPLTLICERQENARSSSSPEGPMAAYLIADIEVRDQAAYDEYRTRVPASLVPYDGKFIVRGGATEILEGDWEPGRIVVIEFPTAERAKAWWNSVEYRDVKDIRQRSASTRMVLVEGPNTP